MKKYKISAEEFDKVSYKRLANSPGANSNYGESKLKGEALKARMDEPFELFMAKFNLLVSLIVGTSDGDSLTKNIPTGINDTHTLYDLILDITSEGAEFASYLSVGDKTLLEALKSISDILDGHEKSKENPHEVTAKQIGLGNADNTSDEDKPLSAAAREAVETLRNEIKTNKEYTDNNFVGRSGSQAIDGELTVKRLYVEGTTYSTDLGSLNVKDRFICANSDGVPMAGLTGFVLRVNGGEAYGIVHDTAGRCVNIGLGVYNGETGEFVFDDGEAQALATRGEIADGELPVWDSEKSTFKGSGLNVDNVAKHHQSFLQKNEVANALKGSASGEVVALKDVSPLEHGLGVRVSSKNLISSDIWDDLFDKQEDGSYLSNKVIATDVSLRQFYLPPAVYTISYDVKCEIDKNYRIRLIYEDDSYIDNYTSATGDYVHYENVTAEKAIKAIQWYYAGLSQNVYFKNLQIELGTTATAYTPFVPDVGAVKVKAQGANIINITEMLNNQLVDNGDGTYTLTKNGSGGLRFSNACEINIPTGVYIKITNEIVDYNSDLFGVQFLDSNNNDEGTVPFFPEKRGSSQYFSKNVAKIIIFADSTISDGSYVKFKNFQIEYGKVGSEYEPYIEPVEYAVNADGTVEGVKSIYPSTTLTTDTVGALIEVEYNRDINKAFEELRKVILSLGGIL